MLTKFVSLDLLFKTLDSDIGWTQNPKYIKSLQISKKHEHCNIKQAKDKSREITGNKYAKSCSASLPIKIKQQVDLCMSVRFKRFLHRSEWRGHRQTGVTGGGLKAVLHLPEGTLRSHRKRSTGADHARTHTSTTDRHADIYVKAHYLRTAASRQRHMAHTAKKERNWTIKC